MISEYNLMCTLLVQYTKMKTESSTPINNYIMYVYVHIHLYSYNCCNTTCDVLYFLIF